MSKTIADKAPAVDVGEFVARQIVNGEEYLKLIRTQHRAFGDRGARISSPFPFAGVDEFATTSTTFTQTNGTSGDYFNYGFENWNPASKLARKLRDGSNQKLEITWTAVLDNAELRIYALKSDDISTAVAIVDLTSSSLAKVSETMTLTEAEAAVGDVAGDPERLLVFVAEVRVFNGAGGSGTATVIGPEGYEKLLAAGDEADLPRGY